MRWVGVIAGLGLLTVAWPAAAQAPEVASYDIEVALDPDTRELTGTETVLWRNTTGAATSELWFHLYLNAFAGTETTFMRELAADPMGASMVPAGGWGWTRITRMSLADGTDLTPGMGFERPDDGNPDDFTVMRVGLPFEVLPGESVELELGFEARLPRLVARTGFAGDFFMVAQWFPKLGVFQGEAGWNCHQFHATSEFFADFGSYRVRMTIPRGWVVGATGEQVGREPVGTADVVEFRARAVHDFAWTVAPPELMSVVETDFDPARDVPAVWLERAADRLDLSTAELELPPMSIRLLVPSSQQALAPRMLRAIRLSVAWLGLHLGPYPQPLLTVVSPPPGAMAAGGMEYPTLITTGASRLDGVAPFSWRDDIESVTVHEIGHQYFQGMLASNEFEQAWLDEGLTTWAEDHCLEDITRDRLAPGIRVGWPWLRERLWLGLEDLPLTIDRPTWEQRRLMDPFLVSYTKTAMALRTLEGLLGEDTLLRAMRRYVRDNRYRHPTGDDLRAALETESGTDLGWFFDAVIEGDRTPDWAVLAVRHDRVGPAEGVVWADGAWIEIEPDDDDRDEPWRVTIEVGRRGDLVGPVEVELVWADGRRERRRWDSRERWVRWVETSTERLEQVVVDPDGAWQLETRRADNYWRDRPSDRPALWWLGPALRLTGLLTVPWS